MITYTLPPSGTLLFAFNRYTAVAEGDEDTTEVLTVSAGTLSFRDERAITAGVPCVVAFSYYLRLFFTDSAVGMQPMIEVDVAWGDLLRHYVVCWGGIAAGERAADRALRYYPALDNPLPYWQYEGAHYLYTLDGAATAEGDGTTKASTIVDARAQFPTLATARTAAIVQWRAASTSTFDSTFDYTFQWFPTGQVRTDITVDCATEGVLLRWIDAQGLWYSWLFEAFTTSRKTKAVGDDYETFATDDDRGYYGALRPRGYTQETTQTIVSPLATVAERRVLDTLLASPLVYWCPDVADIAAGVATFTSARWFAVRIVAATTKDERAPRADYEVTVQYPDKPVQRL